MTSRGDKGGANVGGKIGDDKDVLLKAFDYRRSMPSVGKPQSADSTGSSIISPLVWSNQAIRLT